MRKIERIGNEPIYADFNGDRVFNLPENLGSNIEPMTDEYYKAITASVDTEA